MDNLPVVSCKYLCEIWSYLGGGVHFAFTWSVIPVIVVVIYVGAAHIACGGLFMTRFLYCQTVPGGEGVLCPCYDEF